MDYNIYIYYSVGDTYRGIPFHTTCTTKRMETETMILYIQRKYYIRKVEVHLNLESIFLCMYMLDKLYYFSYTFFLMSCRPLQALRSATILCAKGLFMCKNFHNCVHMYIHGKLLSSMQFADVCETSF